MVVSRTEDSILVVAGFGARKPIRSFDLSVGIAISLEE